MSFCLAVLGATGLVGRTMLQVLEERAFPVGELRLLASDRSLGSELRFRGRAHAVRVPEPEAFTGVQLALFACSNELSQQWAPVALERGARVVDNSSAFRYQEDVPLVVPEVNGDRLAARPRLVANPNCSTIQLVVALEPLRRAAGLARVVVATYQSVSGAGAEALERMEREARASLGGADLDGAARPAPLAFNAVPMIDRLEPNGYSREEMKIVWETRKILGLPGLAITATAARVPVRVGHSEAVNVALEQPLTVEEARAAWRAAPGVRLVDDPEKGSYPMPLLAAGSDEVLVGRVRRDLSQPNGLDFWVVGDNLRKGAATNAVQIAEELVRAEVGSR
jgi:aspartate-semialdehyde dehydrogenase